MPTLPFENRRRATTAKLAALMLANAFIFQEQLSAIEENVVPIRQLLSYRDFVTRTAEHWKMIIDEINYVPIFKVARDIILSFVADADTDRAVRRLAERALDIVSRKAALRHDLMGRIYHLLLLEAKYLGTYYTSVPAATLLLKLTLDVDNWPNADWGSPESLQDFRIADLACGTGTLLMAASQAVTDNFVKFRASGNQGINEASLTALHKQMIEEMLYGYDVLPSAVHLTASTLALLAPETCFHKMHLYSLPLGRQSNQVHLGSIDYISAETIQTQLDLMSPGIGAESLAASANSSYSVAPLPSVDLCVMNPPFVRSVGSNLLFGSIPDQRGQMQAELAHRIQASNLSASTTAGLGAVFAAVGDRRIKPGGRLALVLPAAVTTGIAWGKTRELISNSYVLETVIVSHDPERWNFSENTDLSEVMLIARKRDPRIETVAAIDEQSTQFINLWRNPGTSAHSLAIGERIARGAPAPIVLSGPVKHSISEIMVGDIKYGEATEVRWGDVRKAPWIGGCFAQTDLVRTAWYLRGGGFYYPGRDDIKTIPMTTIGKLGSLGPDRRDIADGFTVSESRTAYPALMGHDMDTVTSLGMKPNRWLVPRVVAAAGRPLRKTSLLWDRAGTIMIAERSRLNTQKTLAVRVDKPALSNVWWPLKLTVPSDNAEKALVMWLNSTLGLLTSLAHRVPTEGAWIQFKKPTLTSLPILDVISLSQSKLRQLALVYDNIFAKKLGKLADMEEDETRSNIDEAFSKLLDLPDLKYLRKMLAAEPIISLKHCPRGEKAEAAAASDQFELELI